MAGGRVGTRGFTRVNIYAVAGVALYERSSTTTRHRRPECS